MNAINNTLGIASAERVDAHLDADPGADEITTPHHDGDPGIDKLSEYSKCDGKPDPLAGKNKRDSNESMPARGRV